MTALDSGFNWSRQYIPRTSLLGFDSRAAKGTADHDISARFAPCPQAVTHVADCLLPHRRRRRIPIYSCEPLESLAGALSPAATIVAAHVARNLCAWRKTFECSPAGVSLCSSRMWRPPSSSRTLLGGRMVASQSQGVRRVVVFDLRDSSPRADTPASIACNLRCIYLYLTTFVAGLHVCRAQREQIREEIVKKTALAALAVSVIAVATASGAAGQMGGSL